MIGLGLTGWQRHRFEDTLRSTHLRRIVVDVQNLDGTTLRTLTPVVLEGEVVVDGGAEVSRSLSMTLLDPSHALDFDTESPNDGALYADRMLRVRYGVWVPALSEWVDVPVFCGPITRLERTGGRVQIEAQGKEVLARNAVWKTLTLKKGLPVTSAIRTIMRHRSGETRFGITNTRFPRLPKTRSFDRFQAVWPAVRGLARSLDRQMFYDGRGILRLRSLPRRPVYTFRDGDGGDVASEPVVSYALDDIKNLVLVVGGRPKGAKKRIRAQATPGRGHPLNPYRLGRNGVPRVFPLRIENSSVTSRRRAREIARNRLERLLHETVEVSFDALRVPHLEPGDLVGVRTGDFSARFRVDQFTIPLTSSGLMSVGYLKKTTPNRRRIRG